MAANTRGGTKKEGIGWKVIRAISHPLRIEIQRILYNRVASPNEIAKELGENLSNVSYHVSDLKNDECIEQVETKPRRGAIEHFYRAVVPPLHDDPSWAKLPKATRTEISGITFMGIVGEGVRALNEDTFDARKDRHLSRVPMELDQAGWEELIESEAAWLAELERIKAEAAQRLEGKSGKRVLAALMGFETPPGPGMAGTGTEE
jgi:DNA-binding transcriptional ArsR family regulator